MRVYLADLVHNQTDGGNVLTGNNDFTVPLNVAAIASFLDDRHAGSIDCEIFKYPNELIDAIDQCAPDILGFSNYAWNTDINRKISIYVKTHYPDTVIVWGGPSMRTDPDGLLDFLIPRPFIDGYVVYEGEGPFNELVKALASERRSLLADYDIANLASLNSDGSLHYREVSSFPAMDDYPSPYLGGRLDRFLDDGLIPLLETNRGCPFSCTFCSWGVNSLNRVRKIPLERVFAEIEYLAARKPSAAVWIVADANFGMLPRDIEIAEKLRLAKHSLPNLRYIITWDSKNTLDRNEQIAHILERYSVGSGIATSNKVCMAIQHLSPHVLENIKRSNIRLGDLGERVSKYHADGVKVTTDILYCLPGERYSDSLDTLRQCFDARFDYINMGRTLMLPGSELETQQSRQNFGLVSRFMLRRGSYGKYQARNEVLHALECDEVIVSTGSLTEQEAFALHTLQWLIFFSWNHGRFAPLLNYAHEKLGMNAIDILECLRRPDPAIFPRWAAFLENFERDVRATMFESRDALDRHFADPENWRALTQEYIRIELRYNAIIYWDLDLFGEACACLRTAIDSDPLAMDILNVIQAEVVDLQAILAGNFSEEKTIALALEAAAYLAPKDTGSGVAPVEAVTLFVDGDKARQTSRFLHQHGVAHHPIGAVERLIGAHYDMLTRDRRWQAAARPVAVDPAPRLGA